ncbi:uncharacterized protein LOC134255512 [Saccostrea cucullata]|uniref:uncharacterized protein LOC134255512 n=1 Tax=Saccostrea cuccullata TaxID=36930 RepID=UPI002ED4C261
MSIKCDIKNFRIILMSKLFKNDLVLCMNNSGNINCHYVEKVKNFYNSSSGHLVFLTLFNYTHHAGNRLLVKTTCQNNETTQENVLLKPCVRDFRTTAYHNNSHITISCEHESFKMSDSGIRIVGLDDLAHCRWNKVNHTNDCFGEAQALENGFQLIIPYKADMNITCKIDEQSINIKVKERISSTASTTAVTMYPIDTTPKVTTNTIHTSTLKYTNVSTSPIILGIQKFTEVLTMSGVALFSLLLLIIIIVNIVFIFRKR